MTDLTRKLTVCATSTLVSAALAWWGLGAWRTTLAASPTVVLHDNTEQMQTLLEERSREPVGRVEPGAPGPGTAWPPPLVREPIDERTARSVFYHELEMDSAYRYVPGACIWQQPRSFHQEFPEHPDGGWRTTVNGAGFRKDQEVRAVPPDLRVVVAGDSHTAGLVPNAESYPNLLEELLRAERPDRSVEVLNAGLGGTHPFTYLGVLEYLLGELEFDVFVVTLYGGNDFSGLMFEHQYHTRSRGPRFWALDAEDLGRLREAGYNHVVAQEIAQVAYFINNPDHVATSGDTVASILAEIARLCEAADVELVCVYLPPAMQTQPDHYQEAWSRAHEVLGVEREHLRISDTLADTWLGYAEQRGLRHLDLRPEFGSAREPLYWFSDHHLNTAGHRRVAEALLPLFEELAD